MSYYTERNDAIRQKRKEGKLLREIAEEFEISIDRIWQICKYPDTHKFRKKEVKHE